MLSTKKEERSPKIAVFGHVGTGNLGDESLIAAVIENVRLHKTGVEFCGLTLRPEDTESRHAIPAFPIRRRRKSNLLAAAGETGPASSEAGSTQEKLASRIKEKVKERPVLLSFLRAARLGVNVVPTVFCEARFLVESYRVIRNVDLMIVAGSQQFIDSDDGTWGHPYTVFKWCLLARATGTKVAFASVGAGPIASPLSRLFVKWAARSAVFRSYRDQHSREVMARLGMPASDPVFPDLVFSLRIPEKVSHSDAGIHQMTVGINPVPFSDPQTWPGSNEEIYRDYVSKLAHFALWLIRAGHKVLFFPTQVTLDPPVIGDIRAVMKEDDAWQPILERSILERNTTSLEELLDALGLVDVSVASRFHGVAISLALSKPTIGVAYHEKTVDLMAQFGQGKFALDIISFDVDQLEQSFMDLCSEKTTAVEAIGKTLLEDGVRLDDQYRQILSLLPDAALNPST